MSALFPDRRDAGRQLATHLQSLAGRPGLVVLGLPRGGVPVAGEVAAALDAPLDVFVVRKIGVPGQEELAIGAIASGGVRVVNQDVVRTAGMSRPTSTPSRPGSGASWSAESARTARTVRCPICGATVILVDDGVATGASMLAGVHALRQLGPAGSSRRPR